MAEPIPPAVTTADIESATFAGADATVTHINRRSKTTPVIDTAIANHMDGLLQKTPIGQISTAIGNTFYGINHRRTPGAVQINKDYYGLTFFTRPQLNLTSENLRMVRQMIPLLTREEMSLQRIIRCLLDPRLGGKDHPPGRPEITSPFVDEKQAFIPILSNTLLSMSGWPDIEAPTRVSERGMYNEVFAMVDGITDNYSTYDITANFRNIPGDPITLLFLVWIRYASLVYQGILIPYPDYIIENKIDYNTRIYRLVLDYTKTRVQKIAACGVSFPQAIGIGGAFNFEADRPINNSADQISVPFLATGAMYQDDILIHEFNTTVQLFNKDMRDGQREAKRYRKIPMEALALFNNRGYPRINPDGNELEWWVSDEDYNNRLPAMTT